MKYLLVTVILTIFFCSSDARRVPELEENEISSDHLQVPISSNDSVTKEEFLRRNDFSTPEECARSCVRHTFKKCYYRFYLEQYSVLSKACDICNRTRSNNCQCILADGVERSVHTVNRMMPGPSIEVCEGDQVIIDVANHLEAETVTVHWHGIHQRRSQYYDGVPYVTQCPILPGNTFRYKWTASEPGTHFWHAHTGFQKMDGLIGSLIVRQIISDDPHRYLYTDDLSEHVIMVQDWMHEFTGERFPGRRYSRVGQRPDSILINGKGQYQNPITRITTSVPLERFKVKSGRRYRFRFINACAAVCPIQLFVEGHNLTVIATDGSPVLPKQVTSIISTSAERYDFVLYANKSARNYWIQIKALGECASFKTQQFAILQYSPGSELSTTKPSYAIGLPEGLILNPMDANCYKNRSDAICVSQLTNAKYVDQSYLKRKPNVKIFLPFRFRVYNSKDVFTPNTFNKFLAGRVELISLVDNITYVSPPSPLISQYSDINPRQFCNGDQNLRNCGLNCKCTHKIDIPLNSIVELILVDEVRTPGLHHPFHLHGYSFHVMGIGRMPNPNQKITMEEAIELDKKNLLNRRYDNPPSKDTLTIPENGYVVLRFIANNPGFWLLHCHFLMHLLTGMSAVFQVGTLRDLPHIPQNFPKCGNFAP